eukprot:Em0013g706a
MDRVFTLCANLGSAFEDDRIESQWLEEFEKVVLKADPDVAAIHFQEIGGKEYKMCMPKVKKFVRKLRDLSCFSHFDRVRGFFDIDFDTEDEFTALGNIYLFHSRTEPVFLWDFETNTFHGVQGDHVLFEELKFDKQHQKEKFPTEFYPDVTWSRKGLLHTKWKLFGSHIFNLVNIHLFHDDDNLTALESPSVYCAYRKKALERAIQSVNRTLADLQEPVLFYGDFNFRLDFSAVMRHIISSGHQAEFLKSPSGKLFDKIVYRPTTEDTSQPTVTVERKRFYVADATLFTSDYKELLQYDNELNSYAELLELPINFQPSYPFSEKIDEGTKYMDKRCPAWCDRIVMNNSALQLVKKSPGGCIYDMMAKEICVGDHKPIYLVFTIESSKKGKGSGTHERFSYHWLLLGAVCAIILSGIAAKYW